MSFAIFAIVSVTLIIRVTNKCSTQFWQFIHAFRFITGSGFLYNLFHALNGISDVDC